MNRRVCNTLRKVAYSWSDAAKDFLPGIGVYALTRALGGSNGLGLGLGAATSAVGAYGRRNWWNEKHKDKDKDTGEQTPTTPAPQPSSQHAPGPNNTNTETYRPYAYTGPEIPQEHYDAILTRLSNVPTHHEIIKATMDYVRGLPPQGPNAAPFRSRLTTEQLSAAYDLLNDEPEVRRVLFEAVGIPGQSIERYSHSQWNNGH